MKRKTKNIIMITLIILVLIGNIVTCKFAKDSLVPSNDVVMENDGSTPPEMPSGDNNSTMEEPHAKPDGDMGTNGEMSEPPAKPDGENTQNTDNQPPELPEGETTDGDAMNSNQPPELPEGENGNGGMMPQGENQQMVNGEVPTNELSVIYYVLFAVEGLALSSLIIYLVMSKFNEKTFKETLKTTDKKIICILSIVLATAILTIAESYIVKGNESTIPEENKEPANGFEGSMNNSNISYNSVKEITQDENITSGEFPL